MRRHPGRRREGERRGHIKDLILGANLTAIKDRDEYLKKQAEAQFAVKEANSSRRLSACSRATRAEPWPLNSARIRGFRSPSRDPARSVPQAGYEPVAPSIIQPAESSSTASARQFRSRTYVFNDLAGEELCLRPDLTVPVSRLYLERHPDAKVEARYCYNGPAFRFQPGGNQAHPREFRQAGIESFGVEDREKADAETVLLAVEAVRGAGLKDMRFASAISASSMRCSMRWICRSVGG